MENISKQVWKEIIRKCFEEISFKANILYSYYDEYCILFWKEKFVYNF